MKNLGAIMFAVCRGKVEGIDFKDELCRAVFIIGLPNIDISNKKTKLKMNYLTKI